MDRARPGKDGSIRLRLMPDRKHRAQEFRAALMKAYHQGGWTVGIDEMYEMQMLGLEPEVIQIYSEGRSERVTCVGGMQRPSWVTRNGVSRWALSQPTHVLGFQVDDTEVETERKILGRAFSDRVKTLKAHQFVYLNQASKAMSIGSAADLERIL